MSTSTITETLETMKWSRSKVIHTKHGEKRIRESVIETGSPFWELYKAHGPELKRLGYSLSKFNGIWKLTEWLTVVGEEPSPVETPADKSTAITAEAANIEVSSAISEKLLPHQIPSVKSIVAALRNFNGAVDGSDLGSGKTYVAIAASMMLGKRLGVVCPKAVIPSWHRAAKHFGVHLYFVINYEMLRTGKTPIGHWEQVGRGERFVWNMPEDAMLVFDECHRLKNAKTKNCKMGIGAMQQKMTVLGVSGTIASNPVDMRFTGELTRLHYGKDFWTWMLRNGVFKTRFGLVFRGNSSILTAIHHHLYPTHGSRIRIADIPDFPDCKIEVEAYDVADNTTKIAATYDEMYASLSQLETQEGLSAIEKKGSELAIMQKARQEAEQLKIPMVCDLVSDAIDDGYSIAIFTNYRETIRVLSVSLNTNCIVQGCSGLKEEADRTNNIDAFQSDKSRVILVNIQAGGAGLSLHDLHGNHPRLALIFPTWSAQDLKQATGRIWRAGAKSKSIQRIVYAAGTIEEEVCEKVRQKLRNIDSINDGDLAPKGLF